MPKYPLRILVLRKVREGRSIKYLVFRFNKRKAIYSEVMKSPSMPVSTTTHNQILIEQRKEDILCPKCGKPLVLLYNKMVIHSWGYADYLVNTCKETVLY